MTGLRRRVRKQHRLRRRRAGALTLISALVLLLLATGCGGGGNAGTPAVRAAATPPSLSARIDAIASAQIAGGLTPSLQIGVARRGALVFDRAYGSRSFAPRLAADISTDYQIASLTKAFTAAAILLLVQSGSLSLDDSLATYIPEYPPAKQITLRQMLTMVSGIPANVDDAFTTLYGPIDHESVVTRLAQFPLDFAPGTRFAYANANYYLLGLVIERVTGSSYASFVTSRIFDRLALDRTAYLPRWTDANTAAGYFHNDVAAGPFVAHPSWSADYLYAMGGLVSDAPDLLHWDESLRAPGLLTSDSLHAMLDVPNATLANYAMGWFVDPDGTRYHDGESGGFHTANALYADGYDIVVLSNTWDQYAGAFDPLSVLASVHAVLPP